MTYLKILKLIALTNMLQYVDEEKTFKLYVLGI